jgi:hypothetical protein
MIAQTYHAAKELEIEDLNRLKEERADLERRTSALRDAAARLMESGNAYSETAGEIRRTNEEFVALQHRLNDITEDIAILQSRMVSEREVAESLRKLDPVWDELYPLEQTRIIQLLVEQVTVNTDGMRIRIRSNGLDVSFAARLLRLTLLAPDIVEAILTGEEPSGLSLTTLTEKLPTLWDHQRKSISGPK